jgi:hypothetical protein
METLVAQECDEKQKSFDITASVRMFRHDLDRFGGVLPETRERVLDEELSYIAEGVDRASRTSFTLQREGGQLKYFDRGEWKPYTSTLITGLRVAKKEAFKDSRKVFLHERAVEDLANGYELHGLRPGQRHVWYSPYPYREEAMFGTEFVRDCGFSPERKMGFLYHAACNKDGSVTLESQSVDNSDLGAFDKVMQMTKYDPEADIETMTRTYDGQLMKRYGGYFFAGKREAEINENVWDQIRANRDLVEYHMSGLENLALSNLAGRELENAVKTHTFGVWAALKTRIDSTPGGFSGNRLVPQPLVPPEVMDIGSEVRFAFNDFVKKGKVLSGCGGSIKFNGEVDGLDEEDAFDSIFGKGKKEKYSFDKKMFCVVCQAPPAEKEEKKYCGPCGLCRDCDKKAGGQG